MQRYLQGGAARRDIALREVAAAGGWDWGNRFRYSIRVFAYIVSRWISKLNAPFVYTHLDAYPTSLRILDHELKNSVVD